MHTFYILYAWSYLHSDHPGTTDFKIQNLRAKDDVHVAFQVIPSNPGNQLLCVTLQLLAAMHFYKPSGKIKGFT